MTSVMEGTMATVDTRTVDAQTGVSVDKAGKCEAPAEQ